jgi:hypothetical protein
MFSLNVIHLVSPTALAGSEKEIHHQSGGNGDQDRQETIKKAMIKRH